MEGMVEERVRGESLVDRNFDKFDSRFGRRGVDERAVVDRLDGDKRELEPVRDAVMDFVLTHGGQMKGYRGFF